MGEVEKPALEEVDPRTLLVEALQIEQATTDALREGGILEHRDAALAYQRVQALAAVAQAMALLQPDPSEVIALYQETVGEVVAEEAEKVAKVRYILETAARDGSRRHPAIHAALEVLGDG